MEADQRFRNSVGIYLDRLVDLSSSNYYSSGHDNYLEGYHSPHMQG